MKASLEIKLNLPDVNKFYLEIELKKSTGEKIMAFVPGSSAYYGEGKDIDEAVSNMLKSMPFYNRPQL